MRPSREEVERAARTYKSNRTAARALDIDPYQFSRLCREYGIATPYLQQLRNRMKGISTKIAVIADDELDRRLYIQMLVEGGYEVVEFADAASALETCNFEGLDLIITDLEMPTRGEELIKRVRGQGIQTPILVISSYVGNQSKRFKRLGVQKILQKPIELEKLLEVVQALV